MAGYADAHGLTFFESIEHMDQIEGMTGRTTKPLGAFRDLMHELADFAKEHDSKPSEVVAEVLDKSGLLEELQRSEDPQDASRVDNLSQLQSVAAESSRTRRMPRWPVSWRPRHWSPTRISCRERARIPARSR